MWRHSEAVVRVSNVEAFGGRGYGLTGEGIRRQRLGSQMWRGLDSGVRTHTWRYSEAGVRGSHVEAFGGRD